MAFRPHDQRNQSVWSRPTMLPSAGRGCIASTRNELGAFLLVHMRCSKPVARERYPHPPGIGEVVRPRRFACPLDGLAHRPTMGRTTHRHAPGLRGASIRNAVAHPATAPL